MGSGREEKCTERREEQGAVARGHGKIVDEDGVRCYGFRLQTTRYEPHVPLANPKPQLLIELFPELSAELEQLLRSKGKPELANQVASLPIIDRCGAATIFARHFTCGLSQKALTVPGTAA